MNWARDYQAGGASERLVAFVDLAPTLLSLVGVKPPEWMQGYAFMGPQQTPPPPHAFGFRGRMDERYDLVRSVRNQRYVYVRQYLPHLIYGQHIGYMFQTPTTQVWRKLYDAGQLQPPQTFFWEPKPPEELYDLQTDPDEVRNLVDSPEHQAVLEELRRAHRLHVQRICDVGFLTEAEQHARAAGTTMYELGHDPQKYHLKGILPMAEAAAGRKPWAVDVLKQGLTFPDSGVRYWAATGVLIRGRDAVTATRDLLRAALQDASPSVRVAAAWALGQHGSADDLQAALKVLGELAPPDKNGAYVSMLTLNAVDALGEKAAPLHELLRSMPAKDPAATGRANGYVARLQEGFRKPGDAPQTPEKKRAKAAGRKKPVAAG